MKTDDERIRTLFRTHTRPTHLFFHKASELVSSRALAKRASEQAKSSQAKQEARSKKEEGSSGLGQRLGSSRNKRASSRKQPSLSPSWRCLLLLVGLIGNEDRSLVSTTKKVARP